MSWGSHGTPQPLRLHHHSNMATQQDAILKRATAQSWGLGSQQIHAPIQCLAHLPLRAELKWSFTPRDLETWSIGAVMPPAQLRQHHLPQSLRPPAHWSTCASSPRCNTTSKRSQDSGALNQLPLPTNTPHLSAAWSLWHTRVLPLPGTTADKHPTHRNPNPSLIHQAPLSRAERIRSLVHKGSKALVELCQPPSGLHSHSAQIPGAGRVLHSPGC
jgi:hypothetical protein